jgi:hypothetical protein
MYTSVGAICKGADGNELDQGDTIKWRILGRGNSPREVLFSKWEENWSALSNDPPFAVILRTNITSAVNLVWADHRLRLYWPGVPDHAFGTSLIKHERSIQAAIRRQHNCQARSTKPETPRVQAKHNSILCHSQVFMLKSMQPCTC